MTVNTQKPIVIFRGDNTAAFDLRTIKILLTGDLDLTNATARFDLLDFTKSWTTEEVATGELSIVFDSTQTKSFALGPQVGTLRLYDMSTGTPRQLTIVNKIPFFVTNRVCEIDSQSYEADVCVSGGDVIHIEFKVGAGAVEGKADKVKNATAGDLANLTADGNLEDSGIPKTDVLRKSQMDSTPTAGSQNPVTSDGIKQAIDAATPSDYARVKAQVEQNTTDISTIDGKIPGTASSSNKLVDQQSMNDAIATNTATFRGSYNAYSDLGVSPPYPLTTQGKAAIAAAIAAKLASLVPPIVPENNDYCFVQVPRNTQDPADFDPTVIERVDRYKCTVTESGGVTTSVWEYEWSLNNSSFTADQWAAINSGITAADVTKLAGIEAGAQVNAVASVNSKTGAVVLNASDVGALGNSGIQTLNGDLVLGEGGYLLSADVGGCIITPTRQYIAFPTSGGQLALVSQIYAAVQQIAPDFTAKAYALNELCTYDGVLYRCKSAYTATASSAKPSSDTTHWEAKKVSELFLPLLGGTMTGTLEVGNTAGNTTINPTNGINTSNVSTATAIIAGVTIESVDAGASLGFRDGSITVKMPISASGTLALTSDIPSVAGLAPLASPAFTGTPTAPTPTAGDDSTKVATTEFVQGALPYAIASVPSGDALADRTVNTKTVNAATYAPSFPAETSGKSCDFYLAITSDTAGSVSAPSGKTLYNAKGESANLDYEANKTTVLRFTQIGANTYVVTGGANGGGSVDPATLNTKLDSVAAAPDYDSTATYAEGEYVTYQGKLYYAKQAITTAEDWTAAHWQVTDMTSPDATLDVTSQGSLRVVSAGGQTLWQQGYKLASASSATLSNEGVNIFTFAAVAAFDDTASYAIGDTVAYDGKAYTFTSAHSGAWTGSDVELAAQSFSLPAAPTGKVGDFILEIDNTANASVAVAIDIAEYTNMTISLVIPDGAAIDDMTAIGGGVRCEFYFTQTAFNANSKPTWKVVRQDVEVVA